MGDLEHKGGLIKSILTSDDITIQFTNFDIPSKFNCVDITPVVNQGSTNSCVSCAIYTMASNFLYLKNKKYPYKYDELFLIRKNKKIDGMSIKDALLLLKDNKIITNFGMLGGEQSIKLSLISNGISVLGLPLRNSSSRFWEGYGSADGFHAVAIVGYNSNGFIIKNSWGTSYGINGFSEIKFGDVTKFGIEIWTLI